jgi:methionyl-tRNA synthetase
MDDRFYVTTPIYYVNDVPHLGTAYTTIVADALARYHKLRGAKTRFLTGTDEHGLKIDREAQRRQQSPQQFVDEMSAAFRAAWPRLLCQFDDFVRTTEPRHIAGVQALWKRCADNGDIYLGEHEGWYCVSCEAYYTEKELGEGNTCKIHLKPVERMKEPSYFFRLSKYGQRLLDLYERRPHMIQPEGRRNEVLAFLREGLRDLSVSRTSFKWGVPVPGDEAHVMYVWFDALANYLTALGDGDLKHTFWPPDVHLVGKDIIRFHAIYWPAFLMSAGFADDQLPRCVFAHGFLTINGQKMGKTLRNVVEPVRLAECFGPDEVRYYLLRDVAFGQDGDFSHRALINRLRGELAATLGNLLNRTLGAFVVKFFDGRVPLPDEGALTDADRALQDRARELAEEAARAWDAYEPQRAIEAAMALAMAGNKYFDEGAPWALAKQEAQRARLGMVLYHILETLRIASLMLWPVMPQKMDALRAQLGLEPVAPREGLDLWPLTWGGMTPHRAVAPGAPLFRNITREDEARILKDFAPPPEAMPANPEAAPAAAPTGAATEARRPSAPPSAPALPIGVIQYGDFEKVELRLGHVKSAERIPKKDKLLKLSVDLGETSGPRTIIAGIALAYAPEQLVGKQLVIVANLAPRDFGKGLVSHGMLLACGPSESLSIVTVEKPMPPGTRVK